MFGIELGESETTLVIAYVGLIVVALWVAIVVWAYRDMRARSRDTIVQIFVGLMVAVLTLPGFLIYLFLRPRETLSEAYERSLEEEALLQEIEEKPSCPGCGQRVEASWQACPNCHTLLKKSCIACRNLLELSWNLCPFCATSQGEKTAEAKLSDDTVRVPPGDPTAFWDEMDWTDMTKAEQALWGVLGWTEESWSEEAKPPASEDKYWNQLSDEEREACEKLGYTKELWDKS